MICERGQEIRNLMWISIGILLHDKYKGKSPTLSNVSYQNQKSHWKGPRRIWVDHVPEIECIEGFFVHHSTYKVMVKSPCTHSLSLKKDRTVDVMKIQRKSSGVKLTYVWRIPSLFEGHFHFSAKRHITHFLSIFYLSFSPSLHFL